MPIYRLVFSSPVASCLVLTDSVGPMNNWFKMVFCRSWVVPYSHTYFHQFPSLDHQNQLRIGQDMTKNVLSQVFCHDLITLLITCTMKILGTNGWHSGHDNNTFNNMYHVYFIHVTSLTSYNGF